MEENKKEIQGIDDKISEFIFDNKCAEAKNCESLGEYLVKNGIRDTFYYRQEVVKYIAESILRYDSYTNENKSEWQNEEWCKGWKCCINNIKSTLKCLGADIKE